MQISRVLTDESVVEREIRFEEGYLTRAYLPLALRAEVEPALRNSLDAIAVIGASYKSR